MGRQTHREKTQEHRDTEGRQLWQDGSRDWSDTPTSHRMLGVTRIWDNQGRIHVWKLQREDALTGGFILGFQPPEL